MIPQKEDATFSNAMGVKPFWRARVMPWTFGMIERFIANQEKHHAITKGEAAKLRTKAEKHFEGKKAGRAISGKWAAVILKEHPDLITELKKSFNQFMETPDFIAVGKKGEEKLKDGRA